MASSTRTQVEQDTSRHTLGHILAKLNGARRTRTTFVVVEGSDDLAFYMRFFDRRVSTAYYSTKLMNDGNVQEGGCQELQNIVRTVLDDGRTDKVIGIMDTDYRRYMKGYEYPQNIFHTDHRDMEMTALSTPSVQQSLNAWIPDFDVTMRRIEPMLRHAGKLRIVNDLYRLGCSFKSRVKIGRVFDGNAHGVYPDWKSRYNRAFWRGCFRKKKGVSEMAKELQSLCKAVVHLTTHDYSKESRYDICQGHDTISLLSLCLVNTATYSKQKIWENCFDAYGLNDFKRTHLYASLHQWEVTRLHMSIIKG